MIDTLRPKTIERFPWAGHIGLKLLPEVIRAIERAKTTLVFTNVRSACEAWYQALLQARPDWAGTIALHHGSLERDVRDWVEDGLRNQRLRAVVCTSSLDLGVDFAPVEQVLQIGSPKGVGRLLQRAGRSGHRPGAISRVGVVPAQAIELVEAAAAHEATAARDIEARVPLKAPLDVLIQHLVTCALGGGFRPKELLAEVRTTHAYAGLTAEQWQFVLDFVVHGGASLNAYPEYRRVVIGEDGIAKALSSQLADATRGLIADARRGIFASPEMALVRPLLELQSRWSALPLENEWLVEESVTHDGHALFFFPFEGRLAHLGLATLFSYRLSRERPRTFSISANDYGFSLVSPAPVSLSIGQLGQLLAAPDVETDILAGLNATELGRRQFREIARVAGLVFQGYPGQPHPQR